MSSTKNAGRKKLTEKESEQLLLDILQMPIRTFPHLPLIPKAFELAGKHNLTLYAAVYIALALDRGAGLFSADKKISHTAERLGLSTTIRN